MSSENQNQGESGAPKTPPQRKTPERRMSGPVTTNPYLNFMREFRMKNKGLGLVEQTIKGADMWRKMTETQKAPFVELARQARHRRGKKGGHKRHHRRRRRSRRGRRHSRDSDY